MKKTIVILTALLLCSQSFAQNYNALRFRQPLAFHQYLICGLHQQTMERDRALADALKKKKTALQYITDVRQRMKSLIGELPERGDLKAQIVGRVQGEGFHVEKIVFQSEPGRYVTAHLYLPDNVDRRLPACVEMCGHGLNGKGNGSMLAYRMAANGIAVMVVDPLSQGERLQLHDRQGTPLTRGVTTEHTLMSLICCWAPVWRRRSISTTAVPSIICSPAATSTLHESEPTDFQVEVHRLPTLQPSMNAYSVPVWPCFSPRVSVPWS